MEENIWKLCDTVKSTTTMNSKHLDGKEDIKYELWGREARKCNFF